MHRYHSSRRRSTAKKSNLPLLFGIVFVVGLVVSAYFFLLGAHNAAVTTQSSSTKSDKPIILYINQGNGLVDESNFSSMLDFAKSHGFNTVFFQVYRPGQLLFTQDELEYFVSAAHNQNLKIFYALYFTNSSQMIPVSLYPLDEDGISLDMSTLSFQAQSNLFSTLEANYRGTTAITTTNFTLSLKPDLLVLETYGVQNQQYIHSGIVASVGVFASSSQQDYQEQFQYALSNSDGVMVFDYYGLLKSGY